MGILDDLLKKELNTLNEDTLINEFLANFEWNSIEESLPEMGVRCYKSTGECINISKTVIVSKDGNCVMCGYFEETDEGILFHHMSPIYMNTEKYTYKLNELSHWMPLPEPAILPKESKNGAFRISEEGYLVDYRGQDSHLIIPNSVNTIGYGSFHDCTWLESITIPDSVVFISDEAFSGCTSLTSIVIPDSVKEIDCNAFEGCTSLTSIVIPHSVIRIAPNTFAGCTSLKSITIPDCVEFIDDSAFAGCTSLESVTIPDCVKFIGNGAFAGCTSLNTVDFAKNSTIKSIGEGSFSNCSSLIHINIPNTLTRIEERIFEKCTSLESLIIPNSVTSIGKRAFKDCTSLRNIKIPNSVKSMGEDVFEGCTKLNRYVFISYKTEERDYADAMKSLLEENGIKTWIAPDNIPAGSDYTEVINDAIENCSCVLMALSKRAQESPHIKSEIRIAFDEEKPIVAMHIDGSSLNSTYKYYLGSKQIVPLNSSDRNDPNLLKIYEAIKSNLR